MVAMNGPSRRPPGPPAHLRSQFVPYPRPSQQVLNVHEAAGHLGIGEEQTRRLLRAGTLVGINHGGVGWVISRESVDDLRAR